MTTKNDATVKNDLTDVTTKNDVTAKSNDSDEFSAWQIDPWDVAAVSPRTDQEPDLEIMDDDLDSSVPDLGAREWHYWLGFLKQQRQEIAHWVSTVSRTNLLIGSKRAWLEAYLLARGKYQRELLMGFRRWDGAGGQEWLKKNGKKFDLRHLRKVSIAAFDKRLVLAGLMTNTEVYGRQRALRCTRTEPHLPDALNHAVQLLQNSPRASSLGRALGLIWKVRAEVGIDRSVRLVPEPAWILEGEKLHYERRKAQKREWKRRKREGTTGV